MQQETAEDGMAGLQSKLQNLNKKLMLTKVNQNGTTDWQTDHWQLTYSQMDIINLYAWITLQSGQNC